MKLFKKIYSFARLVSESIDFAFSQLKVDKFRTFLSLLGVSIGIFSIVAVFSVVDALQKSIRDGFDSFGSDIVFIDRFPMQPEADGSFKWWEYAKRPNIEIEEYRYLKNNGETINNICFTSSYRKKLKSGRNSFDNGRIVGVDGDWRSIIFSDIEYGRTLSSSEIQNGSQVVIIGNDIKENLFPGEKDVSGKKIKIGNKDAVVIGTFVKQGSSMVNIFNTDISAIVPLNFSKNIVKINNTSTMITAKPFKNGVKEHFIAELKNLMRNFRRLESTQKDNFSINQLSFAITQVEGIFRTINLVGWIIGGFSLLIGAFGIANIMFVSVKERTRQIGIQKALGAKNHIILTQFLVESATLSIAGGSIGILLVYIGSLFVPKGIIEIVLTPANIINGLFLAIAIGVIAGVAPARTAAKLNPVEAINN